MAEGPVYRYIGVAEEATYGTEITDDDSFINGDATEITLNPPDTKLSLFNGISSNAPIKFTNLPYMTQGDLNLPLDSIISGYILKWTLGSYYKMEQEDAGEDIFKHTFRNANSVPSFTARAGKDQLEHIFLGNAINSLKIDLPKDFATMTASLYGKSDKSGTLSTVCTGASTDITLDRYGYFAFHQAVATIGGSTVNAESFSIEINNNLSGEDGVRLGSVHPQFQASTRLEINVTCDLTFDSTTQLQNFWGSSTAPDDSASRAVTLTLTGEEIITGHYYTLVFTFPATVHQSAPINVSGRDRVVQTVTMNGLVSESDCYAVQVQLTNNRDCLSLDTHLRAVQMIDGSKVFVAGTRGECVYTADLGTTWTAKNTNVDGLDARINAMFFTSATAGFVVGDNGVIQKTADGGATWTTQTSGVTVDLFGVYTSTNTWVVGDSGTILVTADGGTTWTAQTSGVTAKLNAICGLDNLILIAVGNDGTVLYTEDGGTTWVEGTSGVTKDLMACCVNDDVADTWWIVGETGTVLSCADYKTWAAQTSGTTTTLRSIDNYGLVAIAVGDDGECIRTANGGTTWTQDTISALSNYIIYGVSMISATVAVLCGTFENVYKTANAGDTWTDISLA